MKKANRLRMVDEVSGAIAGGEVTDPCDSCNTKNIRMRDSCGCLAETRYRGYLNTYERVLGYDVVEEAVAIGKLQIELNKITAEIEEHKKMIEKMIGED